MTVYADLIRQAEILATIDVKRPRQANLRRALSATYYAVFHYLVHEACCVQIGSQHAQAAYRHVIARAYSHSVMGQACIRFGAGTLKQSVIKGLPLDANGGFTIPTEVRNLAATFADLQNSRHLADYDLSERFLRSDVLGLIAQVKNRIEEFASLPASDDKKFFLACLWAWKELTNRS